MRFKSDRRTMPVHRIVSCHEQYTSYDITVDNNSTFLYEELKIIWLLYFIRLRKLSGIVRAYNELIHGEDSHVAIMETLNKYAHAFNQKLELINKYAHAFNQKLELIKKNEKMLSNKLIQETEITGTLYDMEDTYRKMYLICSKGSRQPLTSLQNLHRHTYADVGEIVQDIINLLTPINEVLQRRIDSNGNSKLNLKVVNTDALRLFKYPIYAQLFLENFNAKTTEELIENINTLKSDYLKVNEEYLKIKSEFKGYVKEFIEIEQIILDQFRLIFKIAKVRGNSININIPNINKYKISELHW